MKRLDIVKWLFVAMLGIYVIPSAFLYSEMAGTECSAESLKAPFPEKFVRISLEKFHVPKEKWDAIVAALNEKGKDVVKNVQMKAAKMNPNPLEKPKQADVIVKLFKETLLEASKEALTKSGISDLSQIQAIIDDIQEQKREQFTDCLQKHMIPTPESLKNQAQNPQGVPQGEQGALMHSGK